MRGIVDSHVHFFDSARSEGLQWPDARSPYYGIKLPADLIAATRPHSLSACIAIETSRRAEDDQWLLELAAANALPRGVVLNLQPDVADFSARLAQANASGQFLGIRLRPIKHYDLSSPSLRRAFAQLEESGKTVEFGAPGAAEKKAFADLAQQFPHIRWILDHCGHPKGDSYADPHWHDAMQRIARQPNAVAKVTGLDLSTSGARAVLGQLVNMFGMERLLYASNWPVCVDRPPALQITAYRDFFGATVGGFFAANAEQVYGLRPS